MTTNSSSPEKKNLWQKLISPHPSIEDFAERRFASILATLLLVLLPLYFLPEGIRAIVDEDSPILIFNLGSGVLILGTAYFFSRSPYPRWGSRLTILYFTALPFLALFAQPESYSGENAKNALIWTVPIMLMALILVKPQRVKFVVFFQIALYLIIPALWNQLSYAQVFSTLWIIIAVGGIVIISAFVQSNYLHKVEEEAIKSKKNERRFREIFLNSPVALWEMDFSKIKNHLDSIAAKHGDDIKSYILEHPSAMEGAASSVGLLDANFSALELYETDDLEKLKKSLHVVTNPKALLALRDGAINLWMGVRNEPIETIHNTLKGNLKNVIVRFSVGKNYEDNWNRIIVSVADVTRQSTAEASVRRLASAVEASASSIVITDLDGNIEYINPAFSQVTGYTKEEALGENPRVLKSDQHPAEFYKEMWDVLISGETWRGEIVNKKKNGELYWEHASISPVKNELGEVVSYVAVKDDITATKEAEKDLRNLSSATEQSASAVVIADMNGLVEYVNPAFSKITGYTKEEILGNTLQVLRSGKHEASFYTEHEKTIARGEVWRGEVINKRKDGTLYWESQIVSPVRNNLGEITHYVSVRDDITNLKKAEDELRKLSNAAEQSANGIVITDTQGIIEYVNPATQKMTGYSAKELLGKTPNLLKSGKHSASFYTELWEVIEKGETWRGELINRRKDGSFYWESQTITPVKNDKEEVTHYVAVKEDISQAKENEKNIRILSNATEQTANGIVIANVEGIIEYVNPAFTEISGYGEEEAIGQKVEEILFSGEHDEAFYTQLAETIAKGEIWNGEIINKRKDGKLYWESLLISPIKDRDGKITHRVEVKEDITRRKELEQALAVAHEEALVASDMKTQLLANVSHDMRTPLGVILGYTEMLNAGVFEPLNDRQAKATRAIAASSQRLLNFVSDLLNQAQIETGEIILNEALLKPQQLLDGLGGEISLARTQGLILETSIDKNLPEQFIGDSYWLGQIIHNLLSNAIKFTPRGGEIHLRILKSGEFAWKLEVEDNGKGIPVEAQDYIFESFRQVDGSITREAHTGSGLGLSIVNHLIRLMRGEISLDSELGKGSKFIVLLPLRVDEE